MGRGNPNVGDKLEIVEDNEGSNNSDKGDSTDIINGSDVTDILGRIETISSRILTRTKKRRQRLIVDQAGNETKPSSIQTQEFQLIFLNKDEKVVNNTDACEDFTTDTEDEDDLPAETEADQLVATIGNNIEEMIRKNTEDNTARTELSDSLEEVINMLDALQLDMTSSEEAFTIDTSTQAIYSDEMTTAKLSEESVTQETSDMITITEMSLTEDETTIEVTTTKDDSETETTTEMPNITSENEDSDEEDSLLDQTLADLKSANLTETDEHIV